MSRRIPVAHLKPRDVFTYRLASDPKPHQGTVGRLEVATGNRGGHVVILTDGTRLTFDAGQHVIRADGVAS